ncbi:hypothetical protein CRE_06162 [Caenorhabditis remanei]|uniref:RING-type domain-containing protein n=1 Tax=Caenorhabditis remanei TaxID=31234 RepID=E3NIF6_CAERE|nr:hypothetical protein CRE_06162 [Caenorhabditis remanei]
MESMEDFKSNDTVQSTRSDDSSDEEFMSKMGITNLVPSFVRDMCTKPQNIELRVCYDAPTHQSTYTYSITWEDDSEGKEKKILEEIKKTTARKDSFGKGVSAHLVPTTVTDSLIHQPLPYPPPVFAICDGPCKKSFPSNLLNTIGRCGHYICAACYGIVRNSDGTYGCSSAHCNWEGETRSDAKRFFREEICPKQRQRAREMKSLGIDVKSASTSSSSKSHSNSMKSSPISQNTCGYSDETDCILKSSKSSFKLIFPSKNEIIGVKLIILETMQFDGSQHLSRNVAELEFQSTTKIKKAISALLFQKFNKFPPPGLLYHVELQPNMKRKIRRIRSKEYDSMALFDFSQIAEYIVFLMDFGGFVKDGSEINYS